MPLSCPRCQIAMSLVRATPHAGGAAVDLDRCDRCAGLWIDGIHHAAVCPTIAHLPERRTEIALLGRQGAGIARCPRCDHVPYEFTVLEIPIDFCVACTGVWLDGSEYSELPLERAPAADAPRGGPYRQSASRALQTEEVKCADCSARTHLRASYMWERGLICRACFGARVQRATIERAARGDHPTGFLMEALLRLLEPVTELLAVAMGRRPP